MALKATINKLELCVTDMDRQYYETHNMTIAQHPSETDERMMIRILAFALNGDERLEFTKGLCVDDEPELWQKSFSDEIELWVDLGLPSEKRIRQACNKSQKTIIYSYGARTAQPWWDKMKKSTSRFSNLEVLFITPEYAKALEKMAKKNMQIQVTIQDGEIMISADDGNVTILLERWK